MPRNISRRVFVKRAILGGAAVGTAGSIVGATLMNSSRQQAGKYESTLVVAADGSGDYEDVASAVKGLPLGGGRIYLKEGAYEVDSTILIDRSDVTIEGSGGRP